MSDELDLRLKALLAVPERAPDEAFARGVARLVVAEQRMRAARRVAWTRFAVTMLATASLILLFILLARPAHGESGEFVAPFSPATAGLLLLGLWLVVAAPARERLRRA